MSVKTIDFGWADMGSDSMSKCRFQFISCRSSNVVGIKCLSLRSAHFKPRIVFRKIERRNSHFMALRNLISQTSFSIISVNCAFRFKVTSKNHRLKPWHLICLQIFRHLAHKFLDIRHVCKFLLCKNFEISIQSYEKSDCASEALWFLEVTLIVITLLWQCLSC